MKKQRYGVSIVNQEIIPSEEDSPFVIDATEEEIDHLEGLFHKLGTMDKKSVGYAANLAVELEHDDREAKSRNILKIRTLYRALLLNKEASAA